MEIHNTIKSLQQTLEAEQGNDIGFVPTMGALHKGHISLVEKSISENKITVVSVFVNPIQFNNPKDLEKYPRNSQKDFEMLKNAGVNHVFFPEVEEMYPEKLEDKYDFGTLETVMEGEFRPGHFNGVAIVVRKLFDIVKPKRAYFGNKDFQQLAIIKRLVKDYSIPVEIVPCPIIRENDGLAMSSRNVRLSEDEREAAKEIYKVLLNAKQQADKINIRNLESLVVTQINQIKNLKVEYFQIVDSNSLLRVNSLEDAESITACIAVYAGEVRLIDNISIK